MAEIPRETCLKVALLTKASFSLSPPPPLEPQGRGWAVCMGKLQQRLLHPCEPMRTPGRKL